MATVKIIGLLIKTLSKPIAKSLKTSATNHPFFKRICISIAQNNHSLEHRLKLRFLDYDSKAIPQPLSESRAVQAGADFISEFFLFVVAGTVVIAEGVRGRLSSNAKTEELNEKLTSLKNGIESCQEQIKNLEETQEKIRDTIEKIVRLKTKC